MSNFNYHFVEYEHFGAKASQKFFQYPSQREKKCVLWYRRVDKNSDKKDTKNPAMETTRPFWRPT